MSRIVNLDSGVVQGSVLGPLLFVLFINDIANLFENTNCKCKLYADDLKLYSVLETDDDCNILQEKLNAIYDWSCKWQLLISYKKCNVMLLYVGNLEHNIQLLLNGNALPVANEIKDLGVIVDDKLTFNGHIGQIVKRAFSRANLIHKCFCRVML